MKPEFIAKFRAFTIAMQKRFDDKEKEYRDTWKTLPLDELESLLLNQCNEVRKALILAEYSKEAQLKELVDLANRSLTVWIRLTEKEK